VRRQARVSDFEQVSLDQVSIDMKTWSRDNASMKPGILLRRWW